MAFDNTPAKTFSLPKRAEKYSGPPVSTSTLYDTLQENKAAKEAELFEESKAEITGLRLTDDDAKFLASVEEAKEISEQALKKQTDEALMDFRERHEQLTRAAQKQFEQQERLDALKAAAIKTSTANVMKPTATKRTLLGIKPKQPK